MANNYSGVLKRLVKVWGTEERAGEKRTGIHTPWDLPNRIGKITLILMFVVLALWIFNRPFTPVPEMVRANSQYRGSLMPLTEASKIRTLEWRYAALENRLKALEFRAAKSADITAVCRELISDIQRNQELAGARLKQLQTATPENRITAYRDLTAVLGELDQLHSRLNSLLP